MYIDGMVISPKKGINHEMKNINDFDMTYFPHFHRREEQYIRIGSTDVCIFYGKVTGMAELGPFERERDPE